MTIEIEVIVMIVINDAGVRIIETGRQ